jgi:hypothetical protein
MKDPRIKQTPKAAPPLNILVYGNKQRLKKGMDIYSHMLTKEPTVGKYPGPKKGK